MTGSVDDANQKLATLSLRIVEAETGSTKGGLHEGSIDN